MSYFLVIDWITVAVRGEVTINLGDSAVPVCAAFLKPTAEYLCAICI